MLNCLRRITKIHARTRTGSGWDLPPDTFEACGEISGRTVGLVGNGAVPRILTPILVALGARVIYTDTSRNDESVVEWRSLQQLLAESDIVSLHVPLTDDTTRLFDRNALGLMKQGAILINTGRGELIDQSALIDALTTERLAAAGLDVFATEPIPPDDPILSLENVVLTPHVAWQTRETLARSLEAAMENCRRLRTGEALLNQVNSPSI
jgi:phosphoglycerate dehydrogenase-like enzyme